MVQGLCPKIDMHTHPLPPKAALVAARGFDELKGAVRFRGNIDPSFHGQVPSYENLAKMMTNAGIAFGLLNPDVPGFETEARFLADNGFKGVKLHSLIQGFDPLRPGLIRRDLYQAIADNGLVLLPDMGDYLEGLKGFSTTPETLLEILGMAPNLKIIAPHMGGILSWDSVHLLKNTSIMFDVSYAFFVDRFFQQGKYRDLLLSLISDFGPKRFLFGTDFPYTEIAQEAKYFDSLNLDDETAELIGSRNAMQLLGLKDFEALKTHPTLISASGVRNNYLAEISNRLVNINYFMDLYPEASSNERVVLQQKTLYWILEKYFNANQARVECQRDQDQVGLKESVLTLSLAIQLILRIWESIREELVKAERQAVLTIDSDLSQIKALLY